MQMRQPVIFAVRFKTLDYNISSVLSTQKIPSVDVIHVTIVIIVDPVTGNFFFVGPDMAGQVFMRRIQATVNNCNNNRMASFSF